MTVTPLFPAMTSRQLRGMMAALGPTHGHAPLRYTWPRYCYEMRRHCARDKPQEFLSWPTVIETIFVGDAPYIKTELKALKASGLRTWAAALEEPGFGNPPRLPYYPKTSGNLVHHAYHLLQFKRATGLRMRDVGDVLEFGGGYGAMALMAQRLGHSGTWTIVDLPEMSLLQLYYLTNVGADMRRVRLIDQLPSCDEPVSLIVALWSLSEAPLKARDEFDARCSADAYLISYQPDWHGLNNEEWFSAFRRKRPGIRWSVEQAAMGSRYLFGVRDGRNTR